MPRAPSVLPWERPQQAWLGQVMGDDSSQEGPWGPAGPTPWPDPPHPRAYVSLFMWHLCEPGLTSAETSCGRRAHGPLQAARAPVGYAS